MREFNLIDRFLKPLAGENSGGLKDDCASFAGYCITKDILVSGVHFLPGDKPFNLARKALRVNLSDLAASGAKPFGFMLGLALPKGTDEEWLGIFAEGLKNDIEKYNFQMLGGDTVFHDGGLIISVTALGTTPKPILRSGAQPGDNIFVSGIIGDGYLGLQSKLEGAEYVEKYDLPEPRIALGLRLREIATSCIDISDGLLADLGHICQESAVGAEIFSSQIPISDKKVNLLKLITGGDDYELLFTSKSENVTNCHKIGVITEYKGLYLDEKLVEAEGYEHVSKK